MKIISLQARNVKRLTAVDITPTGAVVQITGKNSSGKSSVLDAIYFALSGERAIDPKPIRTGETKASVRLDLGEFIVTRRWTEKATTLTVESEHGARYPSPQKLLDDLLGALTFDPLEFSRMDAGEQAATLQSLVGLRGGLLDAFDRQAQDAYYARTEVNRRVNSLTEQLTQIAREIVPAMDCSLIDVSEILEKMQNASEFNAAIARQTAAQEADRRELGLAQERVGEAERALAALQQQKELYEKDVRRISATIEAHRPPPAPMDVAALRREVQEAQSTNQVREMQEHVRQARQRIADELAPAKLDAETLKQTISDAQLAKRAAIAAVTFPVDGLSLSENGAVLYRGLPFEQASSAEQLRVSLGIAMAMNPKLRVLRVKDGSLLDEDSLKLIAGMVELADYQLWLERVDSSGRVGIVMHDGAVVAVDGEAMTHPPLTE